jgi:hypothetical protein
VINWNLEASWSSYTISDTVDFKLKVLGRNAEGHYILINFIKQILLEKKQQRGPDMIKY